MRRKEGLSHGREIGQTSRDQFAPVRAPDSDPDSTTRPHTHSCTRTWASAPRFSFLDAHAPPLTPAHMCPRFLSPFPLALGDPLSIGTLVPRDIRHRKSRCVAR